MCASSIPESHGEARNGAARACDGAASDLERSRASGATDEIFPLVYAELRRLADHHLSREPAGQTLQPTALVHEAYLRLCGDADRGWESRAHFFGAAARAIRCILIDRARSRRRLRRGGGGRRESLSFDTRTLDVAGLDDGALHFDFIALDDALERLATIDAQAAKIVELRFFGGLTPHETARSLSISESTEARGWRFARIWLHRELYSDSSP
jgi:RNA polymerase sigma factor (TIGR02999 family)